MQNEVPQSMNRYYDSKSTLRAKYLYVLETSCINVSTTTTKDVPDSNSPHHTPTPQLWSVVLLYLKVKPPESNPRTITFNSWGRQPTSTASPHFDWVKSKSSVKSHKLLTKERKLPEVEHVSQNTVSLSFSYTIFQLILLLQSVIPHKLQENCDQRFVTPALNS